MMTNEWITWSGGECPVDGKTWVDIKLDNGTTIDNQEASEWDCGGYESYCWQGNHPESLGDIIAYRLSKEQA